jgi:hypothetical protein
MGFEKGFTKAAIAAQASNVVKNLAGASKTTAQGLTKMEAMAKKPSLFNKVPAGDGKTMQQAQQHIASLPNAQASRLEKKLYSKQVPAQKPASMASASASSPQPSIHHVPPETPQPQAQAKAFGVKHLVGAGVAGAVAGKMMSGGNNQQQR